MLDIGGRIGQISSDAKKPFRKRNATIHPRYDESELIRNLRDLESIKQSIKIHKEYVAFWNPNKAFKLPKSHSTIFF